MFAFWKPERQHMKGLFHLFPDYLSGMPVVPAVTGARARRDFVTDPGCGASWFPILAIRLTGYNYNLITCNSCGFDMVPLAILITGSQSVTLEFGWKGMPWFSEKVSFQKHRVWLVIGSTGAWRAGQRTPRDHATWVTSHEGGVVCQPRHSFGHVMCYSPSSPNVTRKIGLRQVVKKQVTSHAVDSNANCHWYTGTSSTPCRSSCH